MITKCWSNDSEVRPSCEQLIADLAAMRVEYDKNQTQWKSLCSSVRVNEDDI